MELITDKEELKLLENYKKTYDERKHIICCVNWPHCDSYVGTDIEGYPLGRLAKKKLRKVKVPFDQLRSPIFSPVDDTLLCVGMDRGFNDLYLINRKGEILKRLTQTPQDEAHPTMPRCWPRMRRRIRKPWLNSTSKPLIDVRPQAMSTRPVFI